MEFCPTCGCLLQYERGPAGARLFCFACPYMCPLNPKAKIKVNQPLVKKEIEPVFTKEDMKSGDPETDTSCPACGHGRARFKQMQIRSADEPATTIYECLKCEKIWRNDLRVFIIRSCYCIFWGKQ